MDTTINGHEVYLGDDGTLDTIIIVDGKEFVYTDVDRTNPDWFKVLARDAVEQYEVDQDEELESYGPGAEKI